MNYSIIAQSEANNNAGITIRETEIHFGTTAASADSLANPAELFLSAFAACILKNVERFSGIMGFAYSRARIEVSGSRLEKPPRMDQITYALEVYSTDIRLNPELLKKNIEKQGTIYNTVNAACSIHGSISIVG